MRNQWYFECINRTLFRRQINFVTHGYLISFGLEFLFNIMNNLVFSDLDFSFTGKGKRDKSVVLYQISDFSLISLVKRE